MYIQIVIGCFDEWLILPLDTLDAGMVYAVVILSVHLFCCIHDVKPFWHSSWTVSEWLNVIKFLLLSAGLTILASSNQNSNWIILGNGIKYMWNGIGFN